MDVEFGCILVDEPQEGEEFLMALALRALADYLAGGHVEGGEGYHGGYGHGHNPRHGPEAGWVRLKAWCGISRLAGDRTLKEIGDLVSLAAREG